MSRAGTVQKAIAIVSLIVLLTMLSGCLSQGKVAQPKTEMPDWIAEGTVVTYDHYSGFRDPQTAAYSSSVHLLWTIRIDEVTEDSITVTAEAANVQYPEIPHNTYQDTWVRGGKSGLAIWVDPADPEGSVLAPNGMKYKAIGGHASYTIGDRTWPDTVSMIAAVPDTGVEYHLTYDAETGRVLALATIYPTERVYVYYRDTVVA